MCGHVARCCSCADGKKYSRQKADSKTSRDEERFLEQKFIAAHTEANRDCFFSGSFNIFTYKKPTEDDIRAKGEERNKGWGIMTKA